MGYRVASPKILLFFLCLVLSGYGVNGQEAATIEDLYVKATEQTGICPSGYEPIHSVAECEQAADFVGADDTSVEMWPDYQDNVPSGCWIWGDALRFSDNPSNWDFQGNNGHVYVICSLKADSEPSPSPSWSQPSQAPSSSKPSHAPSSSKPSHAPSSHLPSQAPLSTLPSQEPTSIDIVVFYYPEPERCEDRMSESEVDNSPSDFTWGTTDVNVAKAKCVEITACNYVQEFGGSGAGEFFLCKGSVPTNSMFLAPVDSIPTPRPTDAPITSRPTPSPTDILNLVEDGEGYCQNFRELERTSSAELCAVQAQSNMYCNLEDLMISYGKGTRAERCLCGTSENCDYIGTSLGEDGYTTYKVMDLDPCANSDCGHGQCDAGYCVCDAGYEGSSCDRPVPRGDSASPGAEENDGSESETNGGPPCSLETFQEAQKWRALVQGLSESLGHMHGRRNLKNVNDVFEVLLDIMHTGEILNVKY